LTKKEVFRQALLGASLLAILFSGFAPGPVQAQTWIRVASVADGDSISLSNGERVRYLGLNAPERGEPGKAEFLAWEAFQFNRYLVLGKEIRIEFEGQKRDRFNRELAYIYLRDGIWVNRELVKAGYAHVLYPSLGLEKFEDLLAAQQEAIRGKRGIWQKVLQETGPSYRGQGKSRKFHRLDCAYGRRISARNRVIFISKKEAYWLGFSPCRSCRP
jgi:endonuclease YncB( thermonuclease family)